MKYSLVIFSFLFLIIFTFSSTAQETAKANKGEGVLQFLKRFNRTKSFHFDRFIELNRDKLDKNNGLKLGVTYTLPLCKTRVTNLYSERNWQNIPLIPTS